MKHRISWLTAVSYVLTIWHAIHLPLPCRSDDSYENVTALMTYLFGSESGYSPDVRPRDKQNETVTVTITLALVSLVEVDDVKQSVTANGFLDLFWSDERIMWEDYPGYNGIDNISPSMKQIWRPRLLLVNTLSERDLFKDDYSPLIAYSDGEVYWNPGGLIKVSCSLKMNKYPFDKQECTIMFCAMSHYESKLIFQAYQSEFSLAFFVQNEAWEITSTKINITTLWAGERDKFSCPQFILRLTRRPLFFVLNILLPIVLLSLLNNFVFLIPDDSGEKIGYGITVLLSLSVYMTTVSSLVPQASDNLPAVNIYLFVLLICSVFSILASMAAVVLRHADEGEDTHLQAKENYKHAVKNVFRLKRSLTRIGMMENKTSKVAISKTRPASLTEYPEKDDAFNLNDALNAPPEVNKYKAIDRHVNKIMFIISISTWVVVNVCFFGYVLS